LKSFYHNIRSYLKHIQEQNNVNELLENHFEKFKPLADRIYHPIKTMDSIHRYRTPVREILSEIQEDGELVSGMRERAMSVRKYETEDEAGEEILSAVHYTMDVYENLGNTTDEIDKRYHAYIKNSTDKMTYMMSADQSLKGNILDLLKAYGKASGAERDRIGDILEANICIDRQYFLDGESFFHKNILSRRLNERTLEIADQWDFTDDALKRLAEELKNMYSLDRIRRFVEGLFSAALRDAAGNALVESKNIFVKDDADFILLILALLRSREQGMDYTVELEGGSVERNGYHIPYMKFRKKREKGS
jgi:NTP pyrophosphatase (non-canonical NTP hydrolase)